MDGYNNKHVIPVDLFIKQQLQALECLGFDDPQFDKVSLEINEGYRLIAEGKSHVVMF